jgi:hypothetical protein
LIVDAANARAEETLESIAQSFRDPERLRISSGRASSSFEDELVADKVSKARANQDLVQDLVEQAKHGSVASHKAIIELAALIDCGAIQRYLLALHLRKLKIPSKPGRRRDWARDNLIISWVSHIEKLGFKATRNPNNVQRHLRPLRNHPRRAAFLARLHHRRRDCRL